MYQHATLDPTRLHAFQPCIDSYDVGDPEDPWGNNCLASDAVAYSNGLIARAGAAVDLRFAPSELALCSRLATEAAALMGPRWPGMYSANDARTFPFFTVSAFLTPRERPDADLIRAIFGGAICPEAEVCVEPLEACGEWWESILNCGAECEEDDPEFDAQAQVIRPWQAMMRWFTERPELHGSIFVRVIVKRHRGLRGGCVFPQLVIALTERGSLTGISTYLVAG